MRYIITPDTTYESGLWHVIDTQELNKFGEQKCILAYAQEAIARYECNALNKVATQKPHQDTQDINYCA